MSELVASGRVVPEGPVLLDDGRIAFVEQELGAVSVVDLATGACDEIARGPGAWNGLALGSDGFLYGAQNGGVVGPWRAEKPKDPGVQRIGLDGSVEIVVRGLGGVDCLAPNDLAFGPDGRLWFTDPAHPYDPDVRGAGGRVFAAGPDGSGHVVVEVGPVYCNGIGFLPGGELVWVESYGRHVCTLDEDGGRKELAQLPEDHVPDGLAVATDGRIFIASVTSHGVTVVAPDGEVIDHLLVADDAIVTNCCFVGSDLIVTDFGGPYFDGDSGQGRLWRLETDATGLALHRGAL
jgi:gluconolactonase